MNVYFTARCPYCGHDNKFSMEMDKPWGSHMAVYTCDVEEGGCDQPFVVGLELKPQVMSMAIDGYSQVNMPDAPS